jgi:hypothetical protein
MKDIFHLFLYHPQWFFHLQTCVWIDFFQIMVIKFYFLKLCFCFEIKLPLKNNNCDIIEGNLWIKIQFFYLENLSIRYELSNLNFFVISKENKH